MAINLLIAATIFGFIRGQSGLISNYLFQFKKLGNKISSKLTPSEKNQLLNEKRTLEIELQGYNVMDNFAAYAKIQRKINAVDQKLEVFKKDYDEKNAIYWELIYNYGVKTIFAIVFFILTLYYRRTALFKLPDYVDLSPLNLVISYPHEKNHVSFHFWVMSCGVIAGMIKIEN